MTQVIRPGVRTFFQHVPTTAHRPALANLLSDADGESGAQRDAAIRDAHIRHAYTLAEIARHMGLHYATVSRIANRAVHQGKA